MALWIPCGGPQVLGTTISRDLKWERSTASTAKRSQLRMFFVRQLKRFDPPQTLKIQFHTAIDECILTSSITIWFGSSTSQERAKLQRIIRTAERISTLPIIQDIHNSRVKKRADPALNLDITSSSHFPLVEDAGPSQQHKEHAALFE